MPPLPKKKHSTSRSGRRHRLFAGRYLVGLPSVSRCPQCRQPKWPHQICPHCGYYKGREVKAPRSTPAQG